MGNIDPKILKRLSLRKNQYVVPVYSYLLYLKNNILISDQDKNITEAIDILSGMRLLTKEKVERNNKTFILVKKVFSEPYDIKELSDEEVILQYNYKTEETRKITLGEAYANRKVDRKEGWII